MKLPSAVQAYFDADTKTENTAPLAAFAADAIIKDDGKTHVGHTAIAEWWRHTKAEYQATSEPREVSSAGERLTVLAEVRGQFTGSPIMLSFTFTLKDNAIAALEIGA